MRHAHGAAIWPQGSGFVPELDDPGRLLADGLRMQGEFRPAAGAPPATGELFQADEASLGIVAERAEGAAPAGGGVDVDKSLFAYQRARQGEHLLEAADAGLQPVHLVVEGDDACLKAAQTGFGLVRMAGRQELVDFLEAGVVTHGDVPLDQGRLPLREALPIAFSPAFIGRKRAEH